MSPQTKKDTGKSLSNEVKRQHAIRLRPIEVREEEEANVPYIWFYTPQSRLKTLPCTRSVLRRCYGKPREGASDGLDLLHGNLYEFFIGVDKDGVCATVDVIRKSRVLGRGVREDDEEDSTQFIIKAERPWSKLDNTPQSYTVEKQPHRTVTRETLAVLNALDRLTEVPEVGDVIKRRYVVDEISGSTLKLSLSDA